MKFTFTDEEKSFIMNQLNDMVGNCQDRNLRRHLQRLQNKFHPENLVSDLNETEIGVVKELCNLAKHYLQQLDAEKSEQWINIADRIADRLPEQKQEQEQTNE